MGYAVYEDADARNLGVDRWAGYGVPAECDMPDCPEAIDRGLAYKCEGHGNVGWREEEGCGLFFCAEHIYEVDTHDGLTPKPDSREWEHYMLTDESWQQWRDESLERVKAMRERQKEAA